MAAELSTVPRVSARLDDIITRRGDVFVERQPRSAELSRRALGSLAGGVTSSWQITSPQAVWLSHGAGSQIFDVDGNDYVDLHGGYGAGLAGHAHPAVVDAVRRQVERGTHFAQPTEMAIEVAEELGRRFGSPCGGSTTQDRGHHGRRPPHAGRHRT